MNKNKFLGVLTPRPSLFLWIIGMLVLTITLLKWEVGVVGIVLFAFLIYYNSSSHYARVKEVTSYIENLVFDMDNVTKDTLLNFPLPLVFLELDGNIVWYNSLFKEIFHDEDLLESPIRSFIEELHPEKLAADDEKKIRRQIDIKGRHYLVLGNTIKQAGEEDASNTILMLYLIDQSSLHDLKERFDEEKTVVGVAIIDNYDELMQSVEDIARPQILSEIEKKVNAWASPAAGILKKFERDKYLMVFNARYFKVFEERRFEILDSVKEISVGNKIPVTLSIGLAMNGETLFENLTNATAGIDIALGRGGDQVVVKDGENISFYGGKTRELEKRTKVKARVIASALRELILQADHVLIMGHENMDIDCLGSALGLYRVIKNKQRSVNVVLENRSPVVAGMLSKVEGDEEYSGLFIDKGQAIARMDDRTLLIVVDTHRPGFTECPELLKIAEQIVVIDHHRRGSEYIQDAVLVYHETYASSTCELVTELLQYIEDRVKLRPLEAEMLFAGIVVDTKRFTLKTGVRTFEVASFLRRQGVDTISARQYFQNDLETYIARSDVVRSAKISSDRIAISICPPGVSNPALMAAQAADELLNLTGVTAAFVLCQLDNEVIISGRSMGEINVQTILEKLGGGGHLTVAGAQLAGVTIEEANIQLEEAIRWQFENNINKNT